MNSENTVLSERAAFWLRLFVGVVFGLAMALLGRHDPVIGAYTPSSWQTDAWSTLGLSAFVWWAGAGTMRRLSLAAWGAVATVALALLAGHQIAATEHAAIYAFVAPVAWLVLPTLFIAHELANGADHARRAIAPYATYFDQAWKHGVQLLLALLFTGLFWVIFLLGAELLNFIGFTWLRDLIGKDWFMLPATGAAMACAVQLGDVQDKVLVNVRALVLSVLSWLLPVIAVLGLLFLGSLCFSGLAPLWKTKAATASLLAASLIFVLLINAAYQQGDEERPVNIVMKWAARLACLLLPVFALLAAYSLWLRIDEYGLSVERVLAGAGVIVAVLFGLGYAVSAALPGRWLKRLEGVNIAMAFVKVLIFAGLLTPLADPARLSADDQVARIQSGRTPEDRIDWDQLHYQTGRYGTEALKALGRSGRTAGIRAQAAKVQAEAASDNSLSPQTPPADDMSRLKVVYPAGGALPAGFDGAALGELRDCVNTPDKACTAALVDLDGDGSSEVVVQEGDIVNVFSHTGGAWKRLVVDSPVLDPADAAAFAAGKIATQPHPWSDLKIGNTTVTVNANAMVPGRSRARSERWVANSTPPAPR